MTEKLDEIVPVISNEKLQEVSEDADKMKLKIDENNDKANRLNSNGNANDNPNCYW